MSRAWMVVVVAAGCGRFGFEDMRPGTGSGNPDASVENAVLPTTGLVAYWSFNDLSATGSMSTVNGDMAACAAGQCPAAIAGVVGTGARFDGANSCMHVPSMSNWTTTTLTMSAWVNIPSAALGTVLPVINRDADACPSPGIEAAQGQVGFLFMGKNATHYHAWTAGLVADSWHQLGVRWDGTTETVFIDGQCACEAAPGQQLMFDGASHEFEIGCDTNTPVYTNGAIDEVRIYDRALADDEMALLVAIGGRVTPTPQACPTACTVTTAGP